MVKIFENDFLKFVNMKILDSLNICLVKFSDEVEEYVDFEWFFLVCFFFSDSDDVGGCLDF